MKTYTIALGKTPIGKKQFEGDGKTPEGLYFIDNKSAVSKYHKNLNISYPNKDDIKNATASGKSAGGEIKIHGLPNGIHLENYVITDWTLGCIALTNDEIDELFQHIKLGSPILILP
ncbi:MAG: L,D-transpeptidase family protein [Saprospirales bacterium]|nr:L,D-transpeptidase family protein [Saprospirales bacterium]